MDELKKENPAYEEIAFTIIDEEKEPHIANQYDYYLVPTFYIDGKYEDENIWLTQKMLATPYDVEIPAINEYIAKIYSDHELESEGTNRNFRIVQTEGSRQVTRKVLSDAGNGDADM